MGLGRNGGRRVGAVVLACALISSGASTALQPMPAQAAGGTTIDVYNDCGGSTGGAGQALVNALQAAQDGNANSECSALGTGLTGPYTLLLDPSQTYTLTQVNNYSDGPNGLPAIADDVTVESATPGVVAVIERSSQAGTLPFRFFDGRDKRRGDAHR